MLLQTSEIKQRLTDTVAKENRGKAISVSDMYGSSSKAFIGDSYVHDSNFAFFTSALANLHKELAEPKFFVTYLQDIPVTYGGGFVDYSVRYAVNWSGLLDEFRAITANNANYLPRVNAGLTQEKVNVFTYEVAYDLRFIELEKIKKVELQKSIEEIYQNAIVAGWDLFVQKVAYLGAQEKNGLFNHEKVLASTITNTGTTGKGFEGLDDTKVVALFNGIFSHYLSESNANLSLLPDTILVPSFVGSDLSSRFNTLYTSSLRKYLAEHNLAVDESNGTIPQITISTRKELDNLGTTNKGRIVAYKKDKTFLNIDIPYPIQHFITLPNIEKMSYTTAFVGQVSEIQLPYNEKNEFGIVTYWDFTK